MVIEDYRSGSEPVYARAAARRRMLPDGLRYIDSWVVDNASLDRCYQLMETEDPALFEEWCARWQDLVRFEIVPVIASREAAARADASRHESS